ncbi:MAG: type VI secretion system baseplate subunit TssE [Planctomycetota bacterium]
MSDGQLLAAGLLARMAATASRRVPAPWDRASLSESVVVNVRRMLETRLGSARCQPDFGTPAPAELAYGYPASADRFRCALARCLARYEPRLQNPRVAFVETPGDELVAHLRISGVLQVGEIKSIMSIEVAIDGAGHLEVRG